VLQARENVICAALTVVVSQCALPAAWSWSSARRKAISSAIGSM
jgi:hypothetical protein